MALDELEQRQTDRAINTMYSLWSSIITLNGIVMGGISVLFSINPLLNKSNVINIYILGFVSIVLLIWNYLSYRNLYTSLDKITPEYIEGLTEAEYRIAIQKGNGKQNRRKNYVKIRELFSIVLTLFSIAYIFIIIIMKTP